MVMVKTSSAVYVLFGTNELDSTVLIVEVKGVLGRFRP